MSEKAADGPAGRRRVILPAPAGVLETPTAAISRATAPATANAGDLRNGCELQMEGAQPAEDEGRHVLVAPGARRTVLGLGDRDVRHAVEEALDADAGLGAGQRCAGAGVDAVAEGEMLACIRAFDDEVAGIVEKARVAVGGAVEHHDGRAGGDGDAGDCGRNT